MSNLGGIVPDTAERLEAEIPGIGPYTAGAIASIAFKQVTGLVDGNVVRVLTRLRAIGLDSSSDAVVKLIWQLSHAIVDPLRPGDFNQAMMELGATVCSPQSPSCSACPVRSVCSARLDMDRSLTGFLVPSKGCDYCSLRLQAATEGVTIYPVKKAKKEPRPETVGVLVVELKQKDSASSQYLMVQRPAKGLLANLWEFPNCIISDTEADMDAPVDANVREDARSHTSLLTLLRSQPTSSPRRFLQIFIFQSISFTHQNYASKAPCYTCSLTSNMSTTCSPRPSPTPTRPLSLRRVFCLTPLSVGSRQQKSATPPYLLT